MPWAKWQRSPRWQVPVVSKCRHIEVLYLLLIMLRSIIDCGA